VLHFYDHDSRSWRAIENPGRDDIARILAMVRAPCSQCDADVLFRPGSDDSPDVVICHEDGCMS
jgi:hypothetical protein